MDDKTTHPEIDERRRRILAALTEPIKSRIISGLILALPITITISIIYWLFSTLQAFVLDPIAHLVELGIGARSGSAAPGSMRGRIVERAGGTIEVLFDPRIDSPLPFWWERYIAPLIAIGLVLILLYFLGYFFGSRLARLLDWLLLRLPGVEYIYSATRNVIQSLDIQGHSKGHQRVVLVPFPHPGMKALALVTKTLHDSDTGKMILCVYVMTSVLPPAGFTLFVPEEDVTDLDWTTRETFEVILSGGMAAPGILRYAVGGPTRIIVPGQSPVDGMETVAPGQSTAPAS
jgi:uncharacterized membrane protein